MPLVACAMGVYGDDDKATYRKYLESFGTRSSEDGKSRTFTYKSKTWWFYEQPEAIKGAQSRHKEKYDDLYQISGQNIMDPLLETHSQSSAKDGEPADSQSTSTNQTETTSSVSDPYSSMEDAELVVFHPDRPAPFISTDAVELEEGIYVYWRQISHLYETSHVRRSRWARW